MEFLGRRTFNPYLSGPSFSATLFDTHQLDRYGKSILKYRLTIRENGKTRTLFMGSDYSPGAGTVIDSNDSYACLMSFLTLKPGDTDSDYFKNYTPTQLAFCDNHAETLGFDVTCRYGEDY